MKKIIFTLCIVLFCTLHIIAQDVSSHDSISKDQTQSEQFEDVSNETKTFQQKYDNLIKWVILPIYGILGIILIILAMICKRYKNKDDIVEIILSSSRIKEKFSPSKNYQQQNMEKTNRLTERDVNLIVDRVLECLKLNEKERKPSSQESASNNTFIPQKIVYKYLKGKTGKTFSRAENTPEDSYFRLSNESGDVADFEFFGNNEEAIAKRIFHEDICEISGSYQGAHKVEMISLGKAKRIGEQWTVTERIKIRLT